MPRKKMKGKKVNNKNQSQKSNGLHQIKRNQQVKELESDGQEVVHDGQEEVQTIVQTTTEPDVPANFTTSSQINSPPQPSEEDDTPNPLRDKFILSVVAQHLPDQDLRECKLVCRLWSDEFKKALESRKWLRVVKGNYCQADELLRLKLADQTVIVSYLFLVCIDMNNPYFHRLLTEFGYLLNDLAVKKCSVNLRIMMQMLARKLPNLESLCLEDVSFVGEEYFAHLFPRSVTDEQEIVLHRLRRLTFSSDLDSEGRGLDTIQVPMQLEQIVTMCPNLKKLDSVRLPKVRIDFFKDHRWDTLQHLHVGWIETSEVVLLSRIMVKLGSLRSLSLEGLEALNPKLPAELRSILNSVSQSLEDLILAERVEAQNVALFKLALRHRLTGGVPVRSSPFPLSLPKLTRLDVTSAFLQSFDALTLIPNLDTFSCQASDSNYWESILSQSNNNKKYKKVTALILRFLTPGSLCRVAKLFPNVSNLTLVDGKSDDEMLRAVFGGFPKLDLLDTIILDAQGSGITDSGVTGFPKKECEKILRRKNFQKIDPGKIRKYPFIGDLKDLSNLNMDEGLMNNLTDISVLFGFIHLKKLVCLDLTNSKITDVSLRAIGANMPDLNVVAISGCTRVTDDGIRALQMQRKELEIITNDDCTSDDEDVTEDDYASGSEFDNGHDHSEDEESCCANEHVCDHHQLNNMGSKTSTNSTDVLNAMAAVHLNN